MLLAFGTHVVFQPCHNILNDHKQHLLLAQEVRELTALACVLSCLVIEAVRQTVLTTIFPKQFGRQVVMLP